MADDCRRGQQYCGCSGAADVVGLPGIHIECKRVERLNLHDAMDQAVRDAGALPEEEGRYPRYSTAGIMKNGWLQCGWRSGSTCTANGNPAGNWGDSMNYIAEI